MKTTHNNPRFPGCLSVSFAVSSVQPHLVWKDTLTVHCTAKKLLMRNSALCKYYLGQHTWKSQPQGATGTAEYSNPSRLAWFSSRGRHSASRGSTTWWGKWHTANTATTTTWRTPTAPPACHGGGCSWQWIWWPLYWKISGGKYGRCNVGAKQTIVWMYWWWPEKGGRFSLGPLWRWGWMATCRVADSEC